MAHHSSDGPLGPGATPEQIKQFEKFRKVMEPAALEEAGREMLGPTGRFPEGKLAPQDEGELRYRVGGKDGKVIIDYGSPVHSVGLTKAQACELGRLLITRAGYTCRIEIG